MGCLIYKLEDSIYTLTFSKICNNIILILLSWISVILLYCDY